MPELRVAVCTNRSPAAAREAVEAVAAQVGRSRVLVVTSGLAAQAVSVHRAELPAEVVEEPRPGLSRARNRALAACGSDEDVLCFVDDDAVVMPGWADALARAWEEAPERVACIGGPIVPRYLAEPPVWLSPPILPALTVLDLGPAVLDLDPSATTVYGANISFRAGPLRAAGGFDPAFGHTGSRVHFSEEDEAQRALARLGFGVRYVPDARVWHLIGPERLTRASFLRRRYAYGRVLGTRGVRPASLALRQAASSAAGCGPALVSRDQALLMERLVRVAENAGVLAGRRGAPVAGQ